MKPTIILNILQQQSTPPAKKNEADRPPFKNPFGDRPAVEALKKILQRIHPKTDNQ